MAYCRELGTEPYVCLNMGTGTLEEALAWVEYCNGAGDTAWAQRRRRNRPCPTVRRPLLGPGQREHCGLAGRARCRAEEYVRTATRWARAIRMLNPQAKLVAAG